jgi:adenylate cyclase
LALYVPMSLGKFALLALAAVVWQEFYAVLTLLRLRRRLSPLVDWLEGERGDHGASEAWSVAASLPLELLRIWWRGGYPVVAGLGWSAFAVWLLGLQAWAVPVLFLAAQALLAYGNGVPFFIIERALQPLHDELAEHVSEEAEGEALSLPLRHRLLAAVLAIGTATGPIVFGLLEGGHPGLGKLGIATGASFGVSLTILLPFTLLLAGSVVAQVHRLQTATKRIGGGDLSVRVPVTANDETGALTRAFNSMTAGLAERERIREAFGTYVDREVAEHILSEGTSLAGEEVEVTMMFLDIRNFTGFAEGSTATEVVAAVNRLFERVVPIIHAHGGHVDKFIGDGLLAVFGAPRRQDDHADQALAAAIEMAAAVEEEFAGELGVGIGLNSGPVVAGNVGGAGRLEFSVIGDPVNVAARVESATRKTGDVILLSEHTRALLRRDDVAVERRPEVPLKGKSEAVELYAPMWEAPQTVGGLRSHRAIIEDQGR